MESQAVKCSLEIIRLGFRSNRSTTKQKANRRVLRNVGTLSELGYEEKRNAGRLRYGESTVSHLKETQVAFTFRILQIGLQLEHRSFADREVQSPKYKLTGYQIYFP